MTLVPVALQGRLMTILRARFGALLRAHLLCMGERRRHRRIERRGYMKEGPEHGGRFDGYCCRWYQRRNW